MKFTLFTNIHAVFFRDMRLHARAVLVEQGSLEWFQKAQEGYAKGLYNRVRGFGPDSAWPVFEIDLPLSVYKLGKNSPYGHNLFIGKQAFYLHPEDETKDLETFESDDVNAIWNELDKRTLSHIDTPARPKLTWVRNKREVKTLTPITRKLVELLNEASSPPSCAINTDEYLEMSKQVHFTGVYPCALESFLLAVECDRTIPRNEIHIIQWANINGKIKRIHLRTIYAD